MPRPSDRPTKAIVRSSVTPLRLPTAIAVLLILANAPLSADAQDAAPRSYLAQIIGLVTELDEKTVHEAVNGWEAIERIDVSRAAHRLKFAANRSVSEDELRERLSGTGTEVFWMAEVQADGGLVGASYDAHAFPMFEDTGNPVADNARYDADKTAWLAAHPGWVDKNTRPDEHAGTDPEVVK